MGVSGWGWPLFLNVGIMRDDCLSVFGNSRLIGYVIIYVQSSLVPIRIVCQLFASRLLQNTDTTVVTEHNKLLFLKNTPSY